MPPPLEPEEVLRVTFVADQMLGGLAKALRMLGYDTLYWRGEGEEILDLARREGRIILTRRQGLLKNKNDVKIFYISCDNTWHQLLQLINAYPLILDNIEPLSRCLCCNGPILPVKKEDIEDRVPDHIYQTQKDFSACRDCKRVYWRGTHRKNMEATIQRLREELRFKDRTLKDPL